MGAGVCLRAAMALAFTPAIAPHAVAIASERGDRASRFSAGPNPAMTPVSAAEHDLSGCLPEGTQLDQVVSSKRVRSKDVETIETVTVNQVLHKLKARCREGKLVDGKGREIHIYQLVGCWGNPPANYQELLHEQVRELDRLRKKYSVIEIPCAQGRGRRMISVS